MTVLFSQGPTSVTGNAAAEYPERKLRVWFMTISFGPGPGQRGRNGVLHPERRAVSVHAPMRRDAANHAPTSG
jgi:hypothetical protein